MTYLLLIAALLLLVVIFYQQWRPLGGKLQGARKSRVFTSANHHHKRFQNLIDTPMDMTVRDFASILLEQLRHRDTRRPGRPLQPEAFDAATFAASTGTQLVWLGHSTCLLRVQGSTILFDPVFSKRASPFQWLGPKRFAGGLRTTIADLPAIDAVVVSHDHYDHLDYAAIRQLRAKTRRFFVPLGVGAHLERWGVETASMTELDWWESATFDGLEFVCTPARHFSGRRLGDRAATLWASWAVLAGTDRIFFSGDTAYGPHFAEIGKKYGPFTLAMLECGQYDRRWANVHMLPEQTVQAAQALRARLFIPIHWGAFVLALHPWIDPVERASKAARAAGVHYATPQLGASLPIPPGKAAVAWWPPYSR